MFEIATQKMMNEFCQSYEPYSYDEDLFYNRTVKLVGDRFEFDCKCNILLNSFVLEGDGKTEVIFKNFEKGTTSRHTLDIEELDKEINVFTYTHSITFRNCRITSSDFFELQFTDEEEINEWSNNIYDTSKIRLINDDYETNKLLSFLNSYNLSDFREGDHIVVERGIYTHHGVYIGNNNLIHYVSDFDYGGRVEIISIEDFARDDAFWIYDHEDSLRKSEIVDRAYSRLGEENYNLTFNNCEHFAHWCCTGTAWSNQVVFGLLIGNWVNSSTKKYKLS